MPKLLIDLDEAVLEKIQKLADEDHRSRKQYIELIVIGWLEDNP